MWTIFTDYNQVLNEASKARRETWEASTARNKDKMTFLIKKLGDCCKLHQEEKLWTEKLAGHQGKPSTTQDQGPTPPMKDTKGIDILLSTTLTTTSTPSSSRTLSVLDLRPEFAVFNNVDLKRLAEEINITLIKVRWDRRNRDSEVEDGAPKTEQEAKDQDDKEEKDRMEDADSRMIFDLQTKTIDMGARRATDMAHNTRLILPQPRSAAEEAVLGARQMVWKETAARYRKENCSEDGSPKQHNMTQTQRIGMKKLAKRIKAGET